MKLFSFLISILLLSTYLSGAKIYHDDGTFYEVSKVKDVYAKTITEIDFMKLSKAIMHINMGSKNIIVSEDGRGDMPLYLFGEFPIGLVFDTLTGFTVHQNPFAVHFSFVKRHAGHG